MAALMKARTLDFGKFKCSVFKAYGTFKAKMTRKMALGLTA